MPPRLAGHPQARGRRGREPEIALLLERLHPVLPRQAHRFVAVVGPSGSGKSSLVQAGLLPQLVQRRSRWVLVPALVPEDRPTTNLARSLAAVLPGRRVDALAAELARDAGALAACGEHLRAAFGGRSVSVLLVVDQAEELLTLCGERERAAFLTLLRQALRDDPGLWVVATLRSEFLTGFLSSDFAPLFQNPVVVGALGRASLFEVIEKPAARAAAADWGLPFRDWLEAGLTVTAGTDNPAVAYDPDHPLLGMYHAVTGETLAGVLLPGKAASREEALGMWTINNAYTVFQESRRGSIRAGKLADLVVLSDDVLTCPDERIKDITVLMTIINGRLAYER